MSETTALGAQPAAAIPQSVTDSLGRTLTIKKLDALAELDLIEAAGGANSENRRWMVVATLAACVTEISGVPRRFPITREQVRDQVKAVGSEGIAAVMQALTPDEQDAAAPDEAETVARVADRGANLPLSSNAANPVPVTRAADLLNVSERAMIAAKLANLSHGGDRKQDQGASLPLEPAAASVSQRHAADLLNVSERSVKAARVVRDHAVPQLAAKVEAGDVSVSAAADVARLPEPAQTEVVAKGAAEILKVAKQIRSKRAETRRAETAALKAAEAPRLPDGRFASPASAECSPIPHAGMRFCPSSIMPKRRLCLPRI